NDLWLFDTQEYKWNQVEFREMDAKPSPRSGFSFLPCADGIILHGGYCKEYAKRKRPVGVMLDDTWLLKYASSPFHLNALPKTTSKAPNKQSQTQLMIKWERRKRASDAYAPSLRSGCTMTLRAGKGMGILFGGVTDEVTNEETLEIKTFYLFRRYGGIYERGSREYTLDDFYSLQLDKMEKHICLKESDVVIPDGDVESSSEDDEDDDSDDDDDDGDDEEDEEESDGDGDNADDSEEDVVENTIESREPEEDQSTTKIELIDEEPKLSQDELSSQATAFMGVSKDTTRSLEDIQSTPLPGETLATFYARSREYWTQKAHGNSDNQGKQLRRDGFTLAEERYTAYKPVLAEVEKILEEAKKR
ncbi:hypothetical protein BYT27DRAFT_7080582, partial [Phlegmacium glaucopus]